MAPDDAEFIAACTLTLNSLSQSFVSHSHSFATLVQRMVSASYMPRLTSTVSLYCSRWAFWERAWILERWRGFCATARAYQSRPSGTFWARMTSSSWTCSTTSQQPSTSRVRWLNLSCTYIRAFLQTSQARLVCPHAEPQSHLKVNCLHCHGHFPCPSAIVTQPCQFHRHLPTSRVRRQFSAAYLMRNLSL